MANTEPLPGAGQLPPPLAWRPMRPEDEDFQKTLYRSTRDDLRAMPPDPALIEALLDLQYRAQQAGYRASYRQAHYLLVTCAGEPIGRVVLDLGGDPVRLVDLAFLPTARGQGHGKRVLAALQALATRLRRPLALSVYRTNTVARRLYDGMGFETVGGDALIEHKLWRDVS